VAAALTFIAFVAYAFLATPTYRTSAQVVIEPTGNEASPLSPLEAARRLHEAVLDRDILSRFANEQLPGAAADAHIQIARSIQAAFQIDSVDGKNFSVTFRDSDKERVERRCNELAARAVERGPRLLAPEHSEESKKLENERRQRVNELVAFLTAHPDLATVSKGKEATSDNTDAELRAERARLEARLAPRPAPGNSDNPYADPATVDVDTPALTRRLAEINAAIAARSTPKPKASAQQAEPAVTAEWQRLLGEVSRARVAADAAKNAPITFKARLVSRAEAPAWPIEPDRRMLLLWGVIGSLGAFGLSTLTARALTTRASIRGASSFPPPPGGDASSFPPEPGWSSSGPAAPLASSAPPLPLPSSVPERVDTGSPFPPAAHHVSSPNPLTPFPDPPHAPASSSAPPLPQQPGVSAYPPAHAGATGYGSEQPFPAGAQYRPTSSNPSPDHSGMRSERSFRAAIEVNADMPAPAQRSNSSTPPLHSVAPVSSARTTQVLGSPIPPIIAPGSRRTPSSGAGPSASRTHTPMPRTTSYSYVSTPPPVAPKPTLSSGPPAPSSPRPTTISTRPAPPGWRPDLSLLPESRRALCDEIYPQAVDRCMVIAVLDGSETGDAKSRLTAELALALAESGHPRVLVLESDLQRPAVRRFLRVEMPAGAGLSEQLQSRIEARQRRPWTVVECSSSLHVLAEGSHGSPELILSRPFEDCVTELRSFYDFIVLDGPRVSNVPACRAVNDVSDSAVLLATAAGDLVQARSLFPGKRVSVVTVPR
jgi:Mrp family chromosome partitioning ATPase